MKKDLFTTIIIAIIGIAGAFAITNYLLPAMQNVSYKTVESSVHNGLADPDVEVFNYKAVNPTVEVYVGECSEYDDTGVCIEQDSSDGNRENEEVRENE